MTEEQALKVFRELGEYEPLRGGSIDASLRRMSRLGPSDPDEFDVVMGASHIGSELFKRIQGIAEANGCGFTIEGEVENGPPKLVIDTPEPPVVPAVVPK
jgi:hypothetical protein